MYQQLFMEGKKYEKYGGKDKHPQLVCSKKLATKNHNHFWLQHRLFQA